MPYYKVLNPGILESNKGVHIDKLLKLNCLTEKDILAIRYKKKRVQKFWQCRLLIMVTILKQSEK